MPGNYYGGSSIGTQYRGTSAARPPSWNFVPRSPTIYDINYAIGDLWLNTNYDDDQHESVWVLISLDGTVDSAGPVAQWIRWGGAGIETLTGDVGGAVPPDANFNINILGTAGEILVTGNPGTNTLTLSFDGEFASSYPTDAGTAIPAAGVLNVFGGTAGRDINTTGAGNTIRVELNNAITLGDLVNIEGNNALTLTTGNARITAGNFIMQSGTIAAGTRGMFFYGSERFISNLGTFNTFIGNLSGNLTLTTGAGGALQNTCVGRSCLSSLTTGKNNNAFGLTAGLSITTGSNNVLLGQSGTFVTTGNDNTMVGHEAGADVAGVIGVRTGSFNTLIGSDAGNNYDGAESSNILIGAGVNGTLGESNKLRIGSGTGSGNYQLNKAFICGIRGITTDVADAIPVLVDSANQLGTVSSSVRYKENIKKPERSILELEPVQFNYKSDEKKTVCYGFIAEEVEKIAPELVVYDAETGQPETLKYHHMYALLLQEIQKLHKRIELLEGERDGSMA